MSETLTILRTTPTPAGAPRYATKQFIYSPASGEWRHIAYEAGATFTAEERSISNLRDLGRALDRLRRDPRVFVVRGELLPEAREALAANPQRRFRRAKKVGKQGQAATLAERPVRQLMIDVDNYPLRETADLANDPEEVIETAIRDLLPECFHDVACFWQLSASAGFKPGVLKVHLWFWLSEAISNEDLKAFLQVHAPAVDRAPYNAAQPHYIADPIVEGGHDPLPRRTGWIKGLDDEVTLPAFDLAELRAAIRQRRERVATGAGLDASAARTVAGALALLGDDEGHEGWHAPLRRATLLYARQTAPKARDDEALKEACRAAIHATAEREAARRHSPADIQRFCSDAYLDTLIDGAFHWVEASKVDAPQGTAPFHEAPAHDVGDARHAVRGQIEEVLRGAAAWHAEPEGNPRHVAFAIDVGTGKSTAGREAVAEFVVAQKAADLPHRVLWLGPTTKLNTETDARFAAVAGPLGVSVAIHRGRKQDDPLNPDAKMCLDLDAVELAREAGESPDQAVCGGGRTRDGADKPRCPFYEECGYQRQKAATSKADVLIAAHEIAFHELPGKIGKDLALTVMDESWWADALLIGRTVPVDTLRDGVEMHPVLRDVPGQQQVQDRTATDELHAARAKLQRALEKAPEGYLRRETLVTAGLTVAECAAARSHEWARKRKWLMHPGMTDKARRTAAVEAGVNGQLGRFAAMWSVLGDLLAGDAEATGRAEMLSRQQPDGTERWCLSLNSVDSIVEAVTDAPLLLLDATMPADLVRAYLPRLEAAPPVRVKAPYMEVRQVRGGWGKTTLLPTGVKVKVGEDGKPAAYVIEKEGGKPIERPVPMPKTLAELRDLVAGETQGERALVITYMDAEAAFAGLPGVEVAHFNAIAGRDEWGDVRYLFVIGRPRPRSDQVRLIAAALTGNPVVVAESHRETRGVRMADGTGGCIEVRAYAEPAAEAVSAAITDAEVVQAVGRARGINRTEADPVRVWLLADVATPLVVDDLLDWRDLAPSAVERMACRGIFLTSPADAARAYPDLFTSEEAARKALKRGAGSEGYFPDIPLRRNPLRGMSAKSALQFSYRPPGRGQQTRQGWARPDMDPEDVWRWLESQLGELAVFTPAEPVPDAPAAIPEKAVQIAPLSGGAPGRAARERLAALGARLDAAKPPEAQGDGFDPLRHGAWHQRLAAARAGQERIGAAA